MSQVLKYQERTFEKIDQVLTLSKLSQDDLMSVTQTIYFSESNLCHSNFRLLQLNKTLLKEIEQGQTLLFKGDPDENVVLCSSSKTYDIIQAETSNSLLLLNGIKLNETIMEYEKRIIVKPTVRGIFYNYLEVIPGKPYIKKLLNLLNKSMYKGPEHEAEVDKNNLFTFQDLDNVIQSSSEELKIALSNMDVVTIDNKVRLIDFEYHFRVLSYMLNLVGENSWDFDEIDYVVTINSLEGIAPKEVIISLFEKYAKESKEIDSQMHYSYREKDVCSFFAKVLLAQSQKFNLDDFLKAWKHSVPEGMVVDESMLCGIAIIDKKTIPHGIFGFSEKNLPDNISDRFEALFQTKEKWTVFEITPYVKKLTTEKLDVNALLAKYARASTVNGIKYFSSKHCK